MASYGGHPCNGPIEFDCSPCHVAGTARSVRTCFIGIGRKEFKPVVALPTGSYDWQTLSGEFVAESNSIELQIRITGAGEFWLDNLKLEAIE